jgi:hexosaminidase
MQNSKYSDCVLSTVLSLKEGGSKKNSSFVREIRFVLGFPKRVSSLISRHTSFAPNDESYAIVIDETTTVYSVTERGFIYAAATLSQLSEFGELESGFVYDTPIGTERGYRVFLPSRSEFDAFYRMVDLLAYYKFNSIIQE